jgi:hypothetical protein
MCMCLGCIVLLRGFGIPSCMSFGQSRSRVCAHKSGIVWDTQAFCTVHLEARGARHARRF